MRFRYSPLSLFEQTAIQDFPETCEAPELTIENLLVQLDEPQNYRPFNNLLEAMPAGRRKGSGRYFPTDGTVGTFVTSGMMS